LALPANKYKWQKNNLRYADDTKLITKDEQQIAELIERVEGAYLNYGLKLNRQKT